jgi:hypothetical protein
MRNLLTNVGVYLTIAEDAAAESKGLLDAGRTRRPDGGYVIAFDPERKSFKQSLIAIAFAGMYLEASLGTVGRQRLGKDRYATIERTIYEQKLHRLGVTDPKLLADCKRFREARNDLLHEKPIDLESPDPATEWRTAQHEAAFAIETVRSIASALAPDAGG